MYLLIINNAKYYDKEMCNFIIKTRQAIKQKWK